MTEVSNGSFWLGRQEVAEEEEAELARGVVLNEMTASTYIATVMALEDQKYALSFNVSIGADILNIGICWTQGPARSTSASLKSSRCR